MRTFSFILAFAFVLAGPSMAGSCENLPGIGTFAYTGAPVVVDAAQMTLVASRYSVFERSGYRFASRKRVKSKL